MFTALRFRRDDTTAIVSQQDTILNDFKSLNEELRITADGYVPNATNAASKLRSCVAS